MDKKSLFLASWKISLSRVMENKSISLASWKISLFFSCVLEKKSLFFSRVVNRNHLSEISKARFKIDNRFWNRSCSLSLSLDVIGVDPPVILHSRKQTQIDLANSHCDNNHQSFEQTKQTRGNTLLRWKVFSLRRDTVQKKRRFFCQNFRTVLSAHHQWRRSRRILELPLVDGKN